jgi:hypothetical protein
MYVIYSQEHFHHDVCLVQKPWSVWPVTTHLYGLLKKRKPHGSDWRLFGPSGTVKKKQMYFWVEYLLVLNSTHDKYRCTHTQLIVITWGPECPPVVPASFLTTGTVFGGFAGSLNASCATYKVETVREIRSCDSYLFIQCLFKHIRIHVLNVGRKRRHCWDYYESMEQKLLKPITNEKFASVKGECEI